MGGTMLRCQPLEENLSWLGVGVGDNFPRIPSEIRSDEVQDMASGVCSDTRWHRITHIRTDDGVETYENGKFVMKLDVEGALSHKIEIFRSNIASGEAPLCVEIRDIRYFLGHGT